MRFESNAESQFEKLPSLLSYCKKNKVGSTERRYVVTTIWLPNQYPSISLDTEHFRLRISDKQALYLELLDFIESNTANEIALCVDILDAKTAKFAIDVLEGEVAEWEPLGESGWKLTIMNKPKSSKNRKPKNS